VSGQGWIAGLPRILRQRLEGRERLQQVVANTGWLLVDKVLRMGLGLLVSVWLARYLGPGQFGLLNYASAFVAMFSALATLGLEGIVVRDVVKQPERAEEILGTAFCLRVLGALLTILVTMGGIYLLRPREPLTHWLVAITAAGAVFQAFDIIDFWFQASIRSKYTVYARNAAYLLIALVKIALIIFKAPLIAFAWAGLAEMATAAAGLLVVYRMDGRRISGWRGSHALAKRLLADSWPLIFSSTFVLINMLVDKIMLGELAGDVEVGLFSAASRLSEIWYFVPLMVGSSVMPVLIRERETSEHAYREQLQKVYNFMSLVSLGLALPITFLANPIIGFLYGPNYATAGHMLAVHIWSSVFVFHVSIRTRSLTIEGKQRFIAVMSFFTMLFNITFNLVLIPRYGGVGASYASLASWVLCVLLVPLLSRESAESVGMFLRSLYRCFTRKGY